MILLWTASPVTFSKVDLPDGASSSITTNFNALNGQWHEFGDEIVRVKNQGFEEPGWRDCGTVLVTVTAYTHRRFVYIREMEIWGKFVEVVATCATRGCVYRLR